MNVGPYESEARAFLGDRADDVPESTYLDALARLVRTRERYATAAARVAPATPLREAIVRVLRAMPEPASIEDVCDGVAEIQSGHTTASIYETLRQLANEGRHVARVGRALYAAAPTTPMSINEGAP